MLNIGQNTKPTLDEVKKNLEAGKYKEAVNTYALADLAQQLFSIQPMAERYADAFKKAGFPDVEERIVLCHRLLELSGYMTADRTTIQVEGMAKTAEIGAHRRTLIDARDALVRLARIGDADPRLFSVNFGTGDASNVLPAAFLLRALLEKHAAKLGHAPIVKEIVKEVDDTTTAMIAAELAQETSKREAMLPSGTRAKARNALYEQLLYISRIGFALLRKAPDERDLFRLAVVHKQPAHVVADDDDGPIAVITTEEAGVPVPKKTVAATEPADVAEFLPASSPE